MHTSPLYPLVWQIRRLFQQLRSASDNLLAGMGINASQRAVLEFLAARPAHSVPQIAQELTVTRQHIQVLVNELLSLKLLKTLPNPAHKRSPLIAITERGSRLFTVIRKKEAQLLASLEPHFEQDDLELVTQTLIKLQQLLQAEEAINISGGKA